MLGEQRNQMGRDGHVTDAGLTLRRANRHLPVDANDSATNAKHPLSEIQVLAPQFDQLAKAQAAPRADEDERTEAVGHRRKDRFELGQRCRLDAPSTPRTASPLTRRRFAARTSSATAVDRISQEPVDLSPLGRLGRVQSTVPGAHYLGVMSLSETSLNSTSSRRRRRR